MTKARTARPTPSTGHRVETEPANAPLLEETLRTLRESLELAETKPEGLQRARQSVDQLEDLFKLSVAECRTEPASVTVARFVVASVEPPDEFWNILPGRALEDELGRDLYFTPGQELESITWSPNYLNSAWGTTLDIERALEQKGHPSRRRVLERCTEEALNYLSRLAHDCLPCTKRDRPRAFESHRLRLRMATSVHAELNQLLRDWNGEQ